MSAGLKRKMLDACNFLIAPAGVELLRTRKAFADYIPYRKTLAAARKSHMSVGDLLDARINDPGGTARIIERLASLGMFDQKLNRVCEIGPGSGRFLEKIMKRTRPDVYEVYETADDWKRRLVKLYGVVAREGDWRSLPQTADSSVDLVHAHKVFPGLPIYTAMGYMLEMARVVRPGGWIAFDAVTEQCVTPEYVERWNSTGWDWVVSMIPKDFVVNLMASLGVRHVGSFTVPLGPVVAEYLIFRKGTGN